MFVSKFIKLKANQLSNVQIIRILIINTQVNV